MLFLFGKCQISLLWRRSSWYYYHKFHSNELHTPTQEFTNQLPVNLSSHSSWRLVPGLQNSLGVDQMTLLSHCSSTYVPGALMYTRDLEPSRETPGDRGVLTNPDSIVLEESSHTTPLVTRKQVYVRRFVKWWQGLFFTQNSYSFFVLVQSPLVEQNLLKILLLSSQVVEKIFQITKLLLGFTGRDPLQRCGSIPLAIFGQIKCDAVAAMLPHA